MHPTNEIHYFYREYPNMRILIFLLLIFTLSSVYGQNESRFIFGSVHTLAERESYSIFYPLGIEEYKGITIIIHSTQASNPKAYGGMIENLLNEGIIVIYPAYQSFAVSNNAYDNASISSSVNKAYEDIKENYSDVLSLPVALIGHSMGGIIVYELATGQELLPKKPSAVISLAPAEVRKHKISDINFEKIDKYDVFLIIEEQRDKYYKRNTGKKLMDNLAYAQRKRHIIHSPSDEEKSRHLNAWSYNKNFSSKNNSLISYFSRMFGHTNSVDSAFYWPEIEHALGCAFSRENCESFRKK